MSCDAVGDLIAQLAVGRLEFREAEELREHLETGCASCAERLAETQQVAFALSLSPEPVAPSANVKQKLLERIADSDASAEPVPASIRRADPHYPVPLVAGLSAIAAGIVVAVFFVLRSDPVADERDALRAQLAEVSAVQIELETELAEVRGELEISYDEITEVEAEIRELEANARTAARQIEMLRSPTVVVMSIYGTAHQPEARARAFWGEDYFCYLSVENIRDLAAGRTYALWLDTELEGVVRVGTFVADDGGRATLWVPIEGDLGHIARAFVTDEATDDVGPEPTGPVELQSSAEA